MPIRPINRSEAVTEPPVIREEIVARPRIRAVPPVTAPDQRASAPEHRVSQTPAPSGKLSKSKKKKKQPTGDYEEGYCRPPIKNRFDGSRPGPGRPKGSVSHDTMMRRHLQKTRHVTIEGKRVKVAQRELAVMLEVKDALDDKKRRAREYVLAEAARLFDDRDRKAGEGAQPAALFSDEDDAMLLDALRDMLREGEEES